MDYRARKPLPPPDAIEAAACLWRRRTNAPDRARLMARGPITWTRRETTQTATPTQRPDPNKKKHQQTTFKSLSGKKEHRPATFGPHLAGKKNTDQQHADHLARPKKKHRPATWRENKRKTTSGPLPKKKKVATRSFWTPTGKNCKI